MKFGNFFPIAITIWIFKKSIISTPFFIQILSTIISLLNLSINIMYIFLEIFFFSFPHVLPCAANHASPRYLGEIAVRILKRWWKPTIVIIYNSIFFFFGLYLFRSPRLPILFGFSTTRCIFPYCGFSRLNSGFISSSAC